MHLSRLSRLFYVLKRAYVLSYIYQLRRSHTGPIGFYRTTPYLAVFGKKVHGKKRPRKKRPRLEKRSTEIYSSIKLSRCWGSASCEPFTLDVLTFFHTSLIFLMPRPTIQAHIMSRPGLAFGCMPVVKTSTYPTTYHMPTSTFCSAMTCYPPFNIRSIKTLILIVVYLNMCNSLTIT